MSAESFDLYRVYGGRLSNNVTAFTDERSGSTCFRYSQSKGTTIGTVFMFEPMSPLFNYFELEIIKEGRKRTIGVGVAGSTYNATSQPGWGENSIGYNAEDGDFFHESSVPRGKGPKCNTGDTMGVGVEFHSGSGVGYARVWFTRNGEVVGEPRRMKRPVQGFYPVVAMQSDGESVRYIGHSRRSMNDQVDNLVEYGQSLSDIWMRCNGVCFYNRGRSLKYDGNEPLRDDCGVAIAKQRVTHKNHYFELTINSGGERKAVAIGVAKWNYPICQYPGWAEGAVGYHGDDGNLYCESGSGQPMGPTCDKGDTMGCGVEFVDPYDSEEDDGTGERCSAADITSSAEGHSSVMDVRFPLRKAPHTHNVATPPEDKKDRPRCIVYFTMNGERVGESETVIPLGGFHPIVGVISCGENITVNLKPLSG